jgi:hypothetical protein
VKQEQEADDIAAHKIDDQKGQIVASSGNSSLNQQQQAQILVQSENNNNIEFSADDLHGNDTKVLLLLNEQEGSEYSFKGIMRKLQIHQQSLSRALHRLEQMELIQRSHTGGYKLSKMGEFAAIQRSKPGSAVLGSIVHLESKVGTRREYMQLLQTYIPSGIRPLEIANVLVGKWFRDLRWVGMIESATGFTLQWIKDDGSFQINLKMISEYIVIETNAATENEKLQAMIGSYAIYEQITKILETKLVHHRNAYVIRWPMQNN